VSLSEISRFSILFPVESEKAGALSPADRSVRCRFAFSLLAAPAAGGGEWPSGIPVPMAVLLRQRVVLMRFPSPRLRSLGWDRRTADVHYWGLAGLGVGLSRRSCGTAVSLGRRLAGVLNLGFPVAGDGAAAAAAFSPAML
jgi:hypothetical protein